jgi:WD40 repeat protein
MADITNQLQAAAGSAGVEKEQYIAVGHNTSPRLTVYPWSVDTGFGTKVANPSSLPTSNGNGVAFSPSGDAIATAIPLSPYVEVYEFSTGGFGAKFSNPATLLAAGGLCVRFSPAGDAIALSTDATPWIEAYAWSSSGFGTKYSNPATLPGTAASTGPNLAFSPNGDAIAIGMASSPWVSAYPWSVSTGFGAKYSDPASLPARTVSGVAFTPSGNAIAVANNDNINNVEFVAAYPWSVSTGFGTKFSAPSSPPTVRAMSVDFSPDEDAVAFGLNSGTVRVAAYAWSVSGFGTKYSDPSTLPTSAVLGIKFSPTADAIALATNTYSPYVVVFPWSASTGFGTKYTNPGTLPTSAGLSVNFGEV